MNRENIRLSEESQTQKNTIVRLHLHEVPSLVQFIEAERRMIVAWGEGGENGELLFNGYRVSVWDDKEVLWRQVVVRTA